MNNDRSRAQGRARNDASVTGTARTFRPIAWAALLTLAANPANAVDLGAWAQRIRTHARWTSVEFRDPFSGKFLVSRAGTEDARARATLTLTADPTEACLPDVVIVFERNADSDSDRDRRGQLELQIGRRRPTTVPVRIIRQRGDPFEFVQFEAPFDPNVLGGHRVLKLRNPPELRAEFSLRGFPEAWRTARSTCEDFSPKDGDEQPPDNPPSEPDAVEDV